MEKFKVLTINEIEKICDRKKILMLVIISLVAIVAGQIIIFGIRYGFGIRGVNSQQFPIFVLSMFANVVIPLFTALLTIDVFCGEITRKVINVTLVRPVTRFKIFSSKVLAVDIFIAINLLTVMILSILFGLVFNSASLTFIGILKIFLAYFVTIIPATVFLLFISLIANILRNGTAVFFISMLIYIFLRALGLLFFQYSSIFTVTLLDWYNLWIANIIPVGRVIRQLFIMVGCGIMLYSASFYLFDKKDF